MVHDIVNFSNGRRSLCKLLSVVFSIIILLLTSSHSGAEALLWTAAPLSLLALIDASYGSRIKRLAITAEKGEITELDVLRSEVSSMSAKGSLESLYGIFSFSVWPFYLVLGGIMVGLGLTVLKSPAHPETSTTPGKGFPGTLAHNPAFRIPSGANPVPGFRPPAPGGNPAMNANPFANHPNGNKPAALNRPSAAAVPNGAMPSFGNSVVNRPAQPPASSTLDAAPKPKNLTAGPASAANPNPPPTAATPAVPPAAIAPPSPANSQPAAPSPQGAAR